MQDYRLLVSGLMGRVWIAKPTKKPHVMSSQRREVPKSEFIDAILHWTHAQLEEGEDTLYITVDDKVICEITIKDKSIFK